MAYTHVARTSNLLGALSLTIADRIRDVTEGAAGGQAMIPAALVQIGTYPDQPIDKLRRYLGLSHSATVRLVMQLETKGWLLKKKLPGADARAVALALTASGKSAMTRVLKERGRFLGRLVETLPEAEFQHLTRLLEYLLPRTIHSHEESDHACRLCDLQACRLTSCPAETLLALNNS